MSTEPAGGAAQAHNAMIKVVENPPTPPVAPPEPEATPDGNQKEK